MTGRPDYVALEQANRISHHKTRGFNHNPNPVVQLADGSYAHRGHAKNAEGAGNVKWRTGLGPDEFFKMFRQMLINKVNGGDTKFLPVLDQEEGQDFLEWLKEKAPGYLKFKMELTKVGVPLMTEDEILRMLPSEVSSEEQLDEKALASEPDPEEPKEKKKGRFVKKDLEDLLPEDGVSA